MEFTNSFEILKQVNKENEKYNSIESRQRDEQEIQRLDNSINKFSVLRLTCDDSIKGFYDKLTSLNIDRKLKIQQKLEAQGFKKMIKSITITEEPELTPKLKIKKIGCD